MASDGDKRPPASQDLPLAGTRILLVEDNPLNQKLAEHYLRQMGCVVDTANNGLEALTAISANQYRVVLMDCQMPEMDGYEATASIRRLEPSDSGEQRIPIVALTADTDETNRAKCLASGMDALLGKPFNPQDLQALLIQLTDHPQSSDA